MTKVLDDSLSFISGESAVKGGNNYVSFLSIQYFSNKQIFCLLVSYIQNFSLTGI